MRTVGPESSREFDGLGPSVSKMTWNGSGLSRGPETGQCCSGPYSLFNGSQCACAYWEHLLDASTWECPSSSSSALYVRVGFLLELHVFVVTLVIFLYDLLWGYWVSSVVE